MIVIFIILWTLLTIIIITEYRGRVVIISAAYSGGPEFISQPGDQLSLLRFCGFNQTLHVNAEIVT
jgi:hypothetical protein